MRRIGIEINTEEAHNNQKGNLSGNSLLIWLAVNIQRGWIIYVYKGINCRHVDGVCGCPLAQFFFFRLRVL